MNTTPLLDPPSHIEPKVHLLECLVKRYCEPEYARAVELEANQTEVIPSFKYIQLGACGNKSFEQTGVDGIVEQ